MSLTISVPLSPWQAGGTMPDRSRLWYLLPLLGAALVPAEASAMCSHCIWEQLGHVLGFEHHAQEPQLHHWSGELNHVIQH